MVNVGNGPRGGRGPRGQFLGHPVGLFALFFTEMWERFSYYGMRGLLMLYMTNYFKWTQENASFYYKWYTSLVYLTPLLGGFLADKFLGNRWAIIIGATLMAIGHFCMAFEQYPVFLAALIFLILGNGLFKPNMSTQVGRLYAAADPRRDSAYTIFYMGINLGAFLAPLLCGWLVENTRWSYHAGFAAAGVGMVLGLLVYLIFQRWVQELPPQVVDAAQSEPARKGPRQGPGPEPRPTNHYMSEAEAETTPSVMPWLASAAPGLLYVLGAACIIAGAVLWRTGLATIDNAVALALGGGFAGFMSGWIASRLKMAVRDRVLAIFVIGLFVVFFWAAFEQAGNAMNVYADKVTDRYITAAAPEPSVYPEAAKAKAATEALSAGAIAAALGGRVGQALNFVSADWWAGLRPIVVLLWVLCLVWLRWRTELRYAGRLPKALVSLAVCLVFVVFLMIAPRWDQLRAAFNPMPTPWFQSINPAAIFVLAPFFAWLWMWLPRHGVSLSIPMKVAIGVFMQGLAFTLMVWAVTHENRSTQATLAQLPPHVLVHQEGRVEFQDAPDRDQDPDEYYVATIKPTFVHGGRLRFDADTRTLHATGVLSDTDRDRMLRATVPLDYLKAVRRLALEGKQAQANAAGGRFDVQVQLDALPSGFDPGYFGFPQQQVWFDGGTRTIHATVELADKDYKQVLLAGADPQFRQALNKIYVDSTRFKVSVSWLFWFYVLCTIGELCLSPVGLSMVSKLAPARYSTMLMGMWLLTSFFGNFLAGFAGENWSQYHPYAYFGLICGILFVVSAICFVVVRRINTMMHGVR